MTFGVCDSCFKICDGQYDERLGKRQFLCGKCDIILKGIEDDIKELRDNPTKYIIDL